MAVKDRIVDWFIQKVLIPSNEVLDKPGFIITRFSDKGGKVFFRELFLPEQIFSDFEKKVVKKYGEAGKRGLYSIGKIFGYRYALVSRLPTVGKVPKDEFLRFGYFFARYVESTWASSLEYKLDYEKRLIEYDFENYRVCSGNGHGYLFTEGSVAGILAHLFEDKSVEGKQEACQGRGDKKCHLVVAPANVLDEKKIKHFNETDVVESKVNEEYITLNKIAPIANSGTSLKGLMDAGAVTYRKGEMLFRKKRHFIIEGSIVYLIEDRVPEEWKGILFETAFEFGKVLEMKDESLLADYVSAAGWGDLQISKDGNKYKIICHHFPWLDLAHNSGHVFFRGLLSGILSGVSGRKVSLVKTADDLTQGYYAIVLSEE